MSSKPILFNTEMVKAILEGRKTQFRLPLKSKRVKNANNPSFRCSDGDIHVTDEPCDRFTIKLPIRISSIIKVGIKHQKEYVLLKVTNVRVERLQDIKYSDIEKEGLNYKDSLIREGVYINNQLRRNWIILWNSTTKDGYKWEDNPYVFVYEFERIEKQ